MGPNCDDSLMALGNYNGFPERCTTILDGFRDRERHRECQVVYTHPACALAGGSADPGRKFWKNLEKSDVILFVGGLSPTLEGEELIVEQAGFCKGDRTRIELPPRSATMLKKIRQRTGKPVLWYSAPERIGLEKVADGTWTPSFVAWLAAKPWAAPWRRR